MNEEELALLRDELKNDPISMGYSGKSHEQIEKILLVRNRDVVNDKKITVDELFDIVDIDELIQLYESADPISQSKSRLYDNVSKLFGLNLANKSFKKLIDHIFGNQSNTSKNLNKLQKRKGTRIEELGITQPTISDIANALREN